MAKYYLCLFVCIPLLQLVMDANLRWWGLHDPIKGGVQSWEWGVDIFFFDPIYACAL